MEITLTKPIAPGFYRPCEVATDEPVDKNLGGTYATSEVVEGDSSAPIIQPDSTPKLIKFWVMGDGSIGAKKVRVSVDGHVGEGEVAITLDIMYQVATADATDFVKETFKEGTDVLIPV